MLQEILSDPLKLTMLVILIVLEVPAATCLVVMWRKAKREQQGKGVEDDEARAAEHLQTPP